MKKNILFSILIVAVIIALTAGGTYAYLVASDSKDFSVATRSGINTTLTLEPIKVSTNLVPLLDSKVKTAISKSSNKCVDNSNYDVCSLYKVTISNTSTSEQIYGYVKTVSSTYETTNLRYQVYDSSFNALSNAMTISKTAGDYVYFYTGDTKSVFTSSGSTVFYFVVWLTDTNSTQDSDYNKTFNGALGIELVGSSSDKLEATF